MALKPAPLHDVRQQTRWADNVSIDAIIRVRTIPVITSILDTSILDSDPYRYSIPSITTLVTS